MSALKILVTAGPTREPIDPVRFISNYSTGAMGYAIAREAKKRRHKITLIAGPTDLAPPTGVKTVQVTTARQMFRAVKACAKDADCVFMAAAVSDFRPPVNYRRKIKRTDRVQRILLRRNPDILHWLGKRKGCRILVGFCMETEALAKNAQKKLQAKNLDIIVANRIDRQGTAFGPGRTTVLMLGPATEKRRLANRTKAEIAGILLDKVEQLWYK